MYKGQETLKNMAKYIHQDVLYLVKIMKDHDDDDDDDSGGAGW